MKKFRNQNRIVRRVINTIEADSKLEIEILKREGSYNFEFQDWYGDEISAKGKSRKFIISNLFEIYYRWKKELEKQNVRYYLAIWLHEPRLIKSEIVCAIGDKIEYYQDKAFMTSNKPFKLHPNHYGQSAELFNKFNWSPKIDLEPYFDFEIAGAKKLIAQKYHVVEKDNDKIYFKPEGIVWVSQEI